MYEPQMVDGFDGGRQHRLWPLVEVLARAPDETGDNEEGEQKRKFIKK
jgi:hypothetical protein